MSVGPCISVELEGPIFVVKLLREEILEEGTINEVSEALFKVVQDHPGLWLLLTFEEVKHLSSSALGTLIRLNKRVEESEGRLKLCALRKSLMEIFVITKLNRLFEIYDDRDAALDSFKR